MRNSTKAGTTTKDGINSEKQLQQQHTEIMLEKINPSTECYCFCSSLPPRAGKADSETPVFLYTEQTLISLSMEPHGHFLWDCHYQNSKNQQLCVQCYQSGPNTSHWEKAFRNKTNLTTNQHFFCSPLLALPFCPAQTESPEVLRWANT